MTSSADLAFGHEGRILKDIAKAANSHNNAMEGPEMLALLDGIQANIDLLTTEYVFKILSQAAVAQARVAVANQDTIALQDLFCALWIGAKERSELAYCAERDAGEMAH